MRCILVGGSMCAVLSSILLSNTMPSNQHLALNKMSLTHGTDVRQLDDDLDRI